MSYNAKYWDAYHQIMSEPKGKQWESTADRFIREQMRFPPQPGMNYSNGTGEISSHALGISLRVRTGNAMFDHFQGNPNTIQSSYAGGRTIPHTNGNGTARHPAKPFLACNPGTETEEEQISKAATTTEQVIPKATRKSPLSSKPKAASSTKPPPSKPVVPRGRKRKTSSWLPSPFCNENLSNLSDAEVAAAIPDGASNIVHVMGQAVNLDKLGDDPSMYELVKAWMEGDPYGPADVHPASQSIFPFPSYAHMEEDAANMSAELDAVNEVPCPTNLTHERTDVNVDVIALLNQKLGNTSDAGVVSNGRSQESPIEYASKEASHKWPNIPGKIDLTTNSLLQDLVARGRKAKAKGRRERVAKYKAAKESLLRKGIVLPP